MEKKASFFYWDTMSNLISINQLLTKYTEILSDFYDVVKTTTNAKLFGWESEFTQTERFRIIMEEAKAHLHLQASDMLLDVGCGHADLFKYMNLNGIVARYTGVDFKNEYIRECRRLYPSSRFKTHDILSTTNSYFGYFDIICMSGVLNLNIDMLEEGANFRILLVVLNKLMRVTTKGIVCNFLHKRSRNKDSFFAYYNPDDLILQLENIGYSILNMREDYLSNDFTLTIVKKKNTSSNSSNQGNGIIYNSINIYTDGGCSGNPGIGAWAFCVPDQNVKYFGNLETTTNNRMELTATIEALKWAQKNTIPMVHIYTDSQYVQKGITQWISNWIKNGWRTSDKKPVKNQDLWKELYNFVAVCNIEWHWVEGHVGNTGNELAHSLVTEGINQLK